MQCCYSEIPLSLDCELLLLLDTESALDPRLMSTFRSVKLGYGEGRGDGAGDPLMDIASLAAKNFSAKS